MVEGMLIDSRASGQSAAADGTCLRQAGLSYRV